MLPRTRGPVGLFAVGLAQVLLVAIAGSADVLETRDGRILQGIYLGGTQQSVRFETSGAVVVLPRDDVLALTFVPGSATAASAPAPSRTPAPGSAPAPTAPAPSPQASTAQQPAATPSAGAGSPAAAPAKSALARIPAGTRLKVRLVEGIDAHLAAVDDAFTATLETGLGLDGRAVVPAGSTVHGRVAEVREVGGGPAQLKLELTRLILQGQPVDLVTGSQAAAPPAASDPGAEAPARPGIQPGTSMEFRLLQPVDLRLIQ